MAQKKSVKTIIDGINLNSRYFAAMKKEDAVKEMLTGGITKDAKWAEAAYSKMVENVKNADAPPVKVEVK